MCVCMMCIKSFGMAAVNTRRKMSREISNPITAAHAVRRVHVLAAALSGKIFDFRIHNVLDHFLRLS